MHFPGPPPFGPGRGNGPPRTPGPGPPDDWQRPPFAGPRHAGPRMPPRPPGIRPIMRGRPTTTGYPNYFFLANQVSPWLCLWAWLCKFVYGHFACQNERLTFLKKKKIEFFSESQKDRRNNMQVAYWISCIFQIISSR